VYDREHVSSRPSRLSPSSRSPQFRVATVARSRVCETRGRSDQTSPMPDGNAPPPRRGTGNSYLRRAPNYLPTARGHGLSFRFRGHGCSGGAGLVPPPFPWLASGPILPLRPCQIRHCSAGRGSWLCQSTPSVSAPRRQGAPPPLSPCARLAQARTICTRRTEAPCPWNLASPMPGFFPFPEERLENPPATPPPASPCYSPLLLKTPAPPAEASFARQDECRRGVGRGGGRGAGKGREAGRTLAVCESPERLPCG